ncbi:MAG TPA: hypothetical protein PLK77_15780 [Pyrinomonadaceae bacterium]|nr:hypothetical protein [Pyrinomonadaceae bacterium]
MKVLLDHNLDRRLKAHLEPLKCTTTFEQGWSELTNGQLLSAAEDSGFDVLLTADSNIPKQQNLAGRTIAIVVVRAADNRRQTHIEMLDLIVSAVTSADSGTIQEVFHPNFKPKDT